MYFDARYPSDLEVLLSTHDFDGDPLLMERARRAIRKLIDLNLSKYNHAAAIDAEALYGPKTRKRVLVLGQVEEDASIKYGCASAMTNNELVMIAAQENPEAEILYKPHPDVLNNLRRRLSDPDDVRHVCRVIEQDVTLPQALETVDHVYSITSLGGFEALLRGIHVTTMGCPFYAGWGVTDDRQPNPRRTRQLTVEQIFAGAYILYPRYFDPLRRSPLQIEDTLELLDRMRRQRDEAARLEPAGADPPVDPGPPGAGSRRTVSPARHPGEGAVATAAGGRRYGSTAGRRAPRPARLIRPSVERKRPRCSAVDQLVVSVDLTGAHTRTLDHAAPALGKLPARRGIRAAPRPGYAPPRPAGPWSHRTGRRS